MKTKTKNNKIKTYVMRPYSDIEKIRENIYWEKKLKELSKKSDCPEKIRNEIHEEIIKLQKENNKIENLF